MQTKTCEGYGENMIRHTGNGLQNFVQEKKKTLKIIFTILVMLVILRLTSTYVKRKRKLTVSYSSVQFTNKKSNENLLFSKQIVAGDEKLILYDNVGRK